MKHIYKFGKFMIFHPFVRHKKRKLYKSIIQTLLDNNVLRIEKEKALNGGVVYTWMLHAITLDGLKDGDFE